MVSKEMESIVENVCKMEALCKLTIRVGLKSGGMSMVLQWRIQDFEKGGSYYSVCEERQ